MRTSNNVYRVVLKRTDAQRSYFVQKKHKLFTLIVFYNDTKEGPSVEGEEFKKGFE